MKLKDYLKPESFIVKIGVSHMLLAGSGSGSGDSGSDSGDSDSGSGGSGGSSSSGSSSFSLPFDWSNITSGSASDESC